MHALLRIVEKTGYLNIQANTPVSSVSARDAEGRITVKTERGEVRAKTVLHATVSRVLELVADSRIAGRHTSCQISKI